MERLCERPGCSDPASVSYGMRASDLVFWIDSLGESDDLSHGVLCRRHADSMVVPSNWTLDDIRDPDLHLFRPPNPSRAGAPAARRSRRRSAVDQLELAIEVDPPSDGSPEVAADGPTGVDDASADATAGAAAEPDETMAEVTTINGTPVAADGAEPPPAPWTPSFDNDDDLDGLLSARGPLLARAFRGADRRRSS